MYSGVPSNRLFGQQVAESFGNAKINDLGHGLVVSQGDEDIGGFEVTMNDPFLMGVLDGIADLQEQLQPLLNGQFVLVTMRGDRCAPDELHGKVGPAGLRRPGVIEVGDVGVVQKRQRLPLGLEAGHHLPGVHAGLDDLQGHLPSHGVLLLGRVYDPHPPLTQDTDKPVTTDPGSQLCPGGVWHARRRRNFRWITRWPALCRRPFWLPRGIMGRIEGRVGLVRHCGEQTAQLILAQTR
jgi:hypothetical protein